MYIPEYVAYIKLTSHKGYFMKKEVERLPEPEAVGDCKGIEFSDSCSDILMNSH